MHALSGLPYGGRSSRASSESVTQRASEPQSGSAVPARVVRARSRPPQLALRLVVALALLARPPVRDHRATDEHHDDHHADADDRQRPALRHRDRDDRDAEDHRLRPPNPTINATIE